MALEDRQDLRTATVASLASDGRLREIRAEIGCTLMDAAVKNRAGGIDATWCGSCACATCQIVITPALDGLRVAVAN